MSFDPFGGVQPNQPQDPQNPGSGIPQQIPAQNTPAPTAEQRQTTIRERVLMPGMLLIIIGILNLIGGLITAGIGVQLGMLPPEQFEEAMRKDPSQDARMAQLRQMGWSMQDVLKIYLYGGVGLGGVVLLLSLITIIGGIRMISLKSYGLAVFGTICAVLPCISLMSCPCGIGAIVGVWSLAVLFNPDVKAGFQ